MLLSCRLRAADAACDYVVGSGNTAGIAVCQSADLTLETRATECGVIT
jgi:hypothetical protein